MDLKTKIHAESGQQDLLITREFDLPVALLFKAYTEPDLVAQWMRTRVVKMESKKHGNYEFETPDAQGNVVFNAHGAIHDICTDRYITRTFEMGNAAFPAQLEFLEFEKLTDITSKLTIQIIYKSVAHRDQMLQLPFAQGLNMAHNRLQEIINSHQ